MNMSLVDISQSLYIFQRAVLCFWNSYCTCLLSVAAKTNKKHFKLSLLSLDTWTILIVDLAQPELHVWLDKLSLCVSYWLLLIKVAGKRCQKWSTALKLQITLAFIILPTARWSTWQYTTILYTHWHGCGRRNYRKKSNCCRPQDVFARRTGQVKTWNMTSLIIFSARMPFKSCEKEEQHNQVEKALLSQLLDFKNIFYICNAWMMTRQNVKYLQFVLSEYKLSLISVYNFFKTFFTQHDITFFQGL